MDLDAIRRKKLWAAKALEVVHSLLEKENDINDFLDKLKLISQCHYDDVVEERYILKMCGYPLCAMDLHKVPAKKYEISTTTNKVYDISDRKKFCSSSCFKSSLYIRSQLPTSPLWMRPFEPVPEYTLYHSKKFEKLQSK